MYATSTNTCHSGRVFAMRSFDPKGRSCVPRPSRPAQATTSVGAARITLAASQRPTDSSERRHHDVAIIGGGPAGLATAKALQAVMGPGADVKVFEAAPRYERNLGAGVSININGWRALHAIDGAMADRLCSLGIRLQANHCLGETGAPLSTPLLVSDHEANVRTHGHTPTMIHWADIRRVLFEGLPPGTVEFRSRVAAVTPGELGGDPAVLELQVPGEEGEEEGAAASGRLRRVTADLVIAADGYYSRTKRLAFGASGPPLLPAYRGKVIWRALVGYRDPDQMPALLRELGGKREAVSWLADGKPPLRSALAYPVNDNRFVWTCIAQAADIEAAGLPPWSSQRAAEQDLGIQQAGSVGSNAKERCLAVFRNYPRELLDLISRTDPRVITEHGYYTHDIMSMLGSPDWVRGNVVAVGDAAHTGPPDGMGLNMALEDAAVLAAQALDAYCAARLPRVHEMWAEFELFNPGRRHAATIASAFEPLGPGSSGPERTGPSPPPPPPQPEGQVGAKQQALIAQ